MVVMEVDDFTEIARYWQNPIPYDAIRDMNRAQCHAAIDAGMSALNQKQARQWAQEKQS